MKVQLPAGGWRPRPYQIPAWEYLEGGGKHCELVWHRRSGKDELSLHWTATSAFERVGNYWHMLPQANQARKALWTAVNSHSGKRRIDEAFPEALRTSQNDTEMSINFASGSTWQVVGSDNFNSLLGSPPVGMVFSEWALCDPAAWGYLMPILEENGGWAIFNTTPRGKNHAYRSLAGAKKNPAYFGELLSADATGVFTAAQLEAIRASLIETFDEEYGLSLFEQEYHCFKPDALVVCSDKARQISQISVGDTVLTHTGRFRRVEQVHKRRYAGPMLKIESYGSRPLVCTPEHPVYLCDPSQQSYSWKKASDIVVGDWLVTPKLDCSQKPVISQSLAKVITWFVCEGSASGNAVSFSIGAHEPDNVEDLCVALRTEGYDPTLRRVANVSVVSVNSVGLADFLVSQAGSGSHNKRLPLALLKGNEQAVFDTLMRGDGCIHLPKVGNARPVYCYSTVSEGLAQQVQIVGAALGYSGTYSVRQEQVSMLANGREIAGGMSFSVQMRRWAGNDRHGGKTRSAKNSILGRVHTIETEDYVGAVHNLRVVGDESYVVNTRAVHNCSFEAANLGAILGRGLVRAEREGRIDDRHDYDPAGAPIEISSDIGFRDASSWFFWQPCLGGFRIVDFDKGAGLDADEWAERLQKRIDDRGYRLGRIWLPQDAKAKTFAAKHTAIEVFLAHFGADIMRITPAVERADRINAARRVLRRTSFHASKTEKARDGLSAWSYEYDEERKEFSKEPAHNWASHDGDAYSYGAIVMEEQSPAEEKPKERAVVVGASDYFGGATLDDLWRDHQRQVDRVQRI